MATRRAGEPRAGRPPPRGRRAPRVEGAHQVGPVLGGDRALHDRSTDKHFSPVYPRTGGGETVSGGCRRPTPPDPGSSLAITAGMLVSAKTPE
jgi:hypothetical protein